MTNVTIILLGGLFSGIIYIVGFALGYYRGKTDGETQAICAMMSYNTRPTQLYNPIKIDTLNKTFEENEIHKDLAE